MSNKLPNQKGQTLLELVIVITVGAIIVVALTFATISTLRNAQFAKNQSQATKLAQEVLERVRTGRDRDSSIGSSFTLGGAPVTSWSDNDMWRSITATCSSNAYFTVDNAGLLSYEACANVVPSSILAVNGFTSSIIIADSATFSSEKTVTAIVSWRDFSGEHESRQTTILRRL